MHWVDHERVLSGMAPRTSEKGKTFTGVTVDFYVSHEDPKGIKPVHGHKWFVTAWFPGDGTDARDLREPVQAIADVFHETHIAGIWGEGIASSFGRRLPECIAVEVWREDEPFKAWWIA